MDDFTWIKELPGDPQFGNGDRVKVHGLKYGIYIVTRDYPLPHDRVLSDAYTYGEVCEYREESNDYVVELFVRNPFGGTLMVDIVTIDKTSLEELQKIPSL